MQCLQLTRGEPPAMTVDVALSGAFNSKYGYVTIDGTKYTSEQTLKVAKGTSVMMYCGAGQPTLMKESIITLNGTTVAKGTMSAAAEYTFAVTANCSIVLAQKGFAPVVYYTAAITMPA